MGWISDDFPTVSLVFSLLLVHVPFETSSKTLKSEITKLFFFCLCVQEKQLKVKQQSTKGTVLTGEGSLFFLQWTEPNFSMIPARFLFAFMAEVYSPIFISSLFIL